jgi:hypothetical protein
MALHGAWLKLGVAASLHIRQVDELRTALTNEAERAA